MQIIDNVLTQFIDNKKKYVVLSAPTGAGKSIIAVVIAQCMRFLTAQKFLDLKSTYILMHNKALQQQYYNTFQGKQDFANIMGAGNYECKQMKGTGQDCVIKGIYNPNVFTRQSCKGCKYKQSRLNLIRAPHVITNYSFYFIMGLTKKFLSRRLLTIYDQSHLINDIFCNHMQIRLTPKSVQLLINLINKYPITNHELIESKLLKHKKLLQSNKLSEKNYLDFLQQFFADILFIKQEYASIVQDLHESGDIQTCKIYNKIYGRFMNLYSKFQGLTDFQYEYTIDFKQGLSLQPIFVGKVFKQSQTSQYCLFMSATNQKDFIVNTLQLQESKVAFIKAKPTFKPQNKQVNFINHARYNYTNLSDQKTLNEINQIVYNIIDQNNHQNGVILTPSFKINQSIVKYLDKKIRNVNILYQIQGQQLAPVLQQFINCTEPSVLISPSLWQGISLDDSISRYQIIIKAPYLNLGQKRIKYILDNYPNIYQIQTLFKLIQGMGRSTRSTTDYSVSYCLDTNCKILFNSKFNVWKDQFLVQDL